MSRRPRRQYPLQEDPVDVRIGVLHTPKEIEIDLPAGTDREELRATVDAALADESSVLWLTDRHGRDVAVPAAKIAYIEVGSPDSERRIGFGAG
jgi:hypothetical protein